jgi:hypothetical protein
MIDHVSARCERFRLLLPTRNIEAIVPLSPSAHITPLHGPLRRAKAPLAVDLRRLLGAPAPPPQTACIRLDWVSCDTERRAILLVDTVDEIVNSPHGHLERLPRLPLRLLQLCDGVLHDPDGTYRMSVRLDVAWPMHAWSERRLWRQSIVTLGAPGEPGPEDFHSLVNPLA